MPAVVVRAARLDFLRHILGREMVLRLFGNDVEPGERDTAASFVEPDFRGYKPLPLQAALWQVHMNEEDEMPWASYPAQLFRSSSNQGARPVYGYFVTAADGGALCWAERFEDGPYKVRNFEDTIQVKLLVSHETVGAKKAPPSEGV